MMNIEARRNSTYMELIITSGDTTMSSGLLDEDEAVQAAQELISVAGDLLPAGYGEAEHRLSDIEESLGESR